MENNIMSFIFDNLVAFQDNNTVDAYRKLRVSNQYGIFNSSLQNSIGEEEWEFVSSGTASTTYLSEQSSLQLSIGTANGDRAMRQTIRTFQYESGTGMDVMMTGVLGQTQVGTSARLGIYDDFNGVFFEEKDGNFGVVLRRTLSAGVTEDIRVEQANFSNDPLDGTGPSKYNIDVTKAQLFNLDYAWLGVGRVRISIWTGTCFCVIHEFKYNNILDTPYMGKGDLPLRYELINTAAVASPSTMKQICAAVFIEGGLNPDGYARSAITPANTEYDLDNNTDFFSLVSVRVKAGFNRINIKPTSMNMTMIAGDSVHMCLFLNPTFTTTPTWSDVDNFSEFSTTNSILTGGTLLAAHATEKDGSLTFDLSKIRDVATTRYDGTQDILCLAARKIKGGTKIAGALNFMVYR
jgi:hypothetical protein